MSISESICPNKTDASPLDVHSASPLTEYLRILRQIMADLSPCNSLHHALDSLLSVLAESLHFRRPHIIVQDPESGKLRLSLSYNKADAPQAAYAPGKGITGQVFAAARPIIVPCMKEHPDFRNRLFERDEDELAHSAFICVPVCVMGAEGREVVGTLSADTPTAPDNELRERCQFLETVACLAGRQVAWLQEEMSARHFLAQARLEPVDSGADSPIIAVSKNMRQVMRQVEQAAPSRATVLLRGESGVGKELLAAAIHKASPRRGKPYVKLNCAAIPADLVEGELFGWKKGAFTGAHQNRRGVFEQADGGTLFLDEIGDLSLSAQAKVLRALQDQDIQVLGSERLISVNVRLVCATNRPLERMVEEKLFREDLYYRINVFPVYVPPLRERRDDILPLVDSYLACFSREYRRAACRISAPALDMLLQYPWPGNIRELKNALERAVLVCEDGVIRAHHFPPSLQTPESTRLLCPSPAGFAETIGRMECELLTDALRGARGNIHQAARDCGLTYRIFQYKLKKYGIDFHAFTADIPA